ncbi:exosortase family protein XrtF [Pustulibacterium marinum]|uniref:Exosortase family protein XrtF n=1 Tax=Pustulibacterium marinum TaxID=1224947 RepID=A0A1I7EZG4_9FLAO|nr:exosortase family protein XrtF [Pustulibacterium marinum]SFU29274.1 exosortase family protein XrtF [Pustulibacterium marinum]
MKEYFQKYSAAIGFVLRFLIVYAALTALYNWFIASAAPYPDQITTWVTEQSEWILEYSPYHIRMVLDDTDPFYRVMINDTYAARIIEGCNSVSVLILFVTFIIAFRGSWKHTVLYSLGGIVLLYLTNLFRIVILTMGVYKYPEYTEILHQLVFPAIIYGAMFILWIIWVKKFTKA